LDYIIHEHNNCCLIVHRINDNVRFISFIFYYFTVPGYDLLVILAIHKKIDTINRILSSILLFLGVYVLFIFNYSFSSIGKVAHRPYNKLNSIVAGKPIPRILKLKVLGLIEKLSGPVIGIYCLDFLPFNNYEFYLFITNCVLNFILFMGLFTK